MCGIVGYIGKSQAAPLLIEGLTRLEYRGYDSAGIAVIDDNKIEIRKAEGRLNNLMGTEELTGNVGIGHTRWATHGAPEVRNAHPHISKSGRFALVHNGIIENYEELKKFLEERGFEFVSDTDSEAIAHLIDYYYTGDVVSALIKTAYRLNGSYALGIICRSEHRLYAMKKDSPLVVGLCDDCTYIASDMQALIEKTRDFYIMENGEIAIMDENKADILNLNGEPIKKQVYHATWDKSVAFKHGYTHFMLKEIHEQPKAIKDTIDAHIGAPLDFLKDIKGIHIVGCGSAYHAALMGKYIIESLTGIRVNADIASEFRYRNPIINSGDLLLAISQSGETADTIGALKIGEGRCRSACIVNVPESSLTHISAPMYTLAGPEVAVATTKGFTTQLVNLYIIAENLLKMKGDARYKQLHHEIEILPELVTEALKTEPQMQQLGVRIAAHDYAFFIGRGADFAAAKESALKLKEISYIHADCYPAGELKHGTISLIEQGSVVVAIATDKALLEKTISNIIEVKARGAFVIGVSCYDISHVCDVTLKVPQSEYVSPVLASVACQLLAYYTASARGCDIDKPRNLAKSVTVE